MTLNEALKELTALGTAKVRAQNAKGGAGNNQFGVFYSFDCNEAMHVHVRRDRQHAKFWLDPAELAWNHGFSRTLTKT